MSGILGISTRALMAFQNALTTTSHNIANANTEGYSRQRVGFATESPEFAGFGYVGRGVKIGDITRVYDQFVVEQVRTSQSSVNRDQTYLTLASDVDNLLADEATGLTPGLQSFFSSVQEVANDPTSAAARQVMLAEGETLAARFQNLDQALNDSRSRINAQMVNVTSEINSFAQAVADLNEDIAKAFAQGMGQAPNDLLDQRDAVIEELAQRVTVSVVNQDDGMANVFIGTGQSLVLGSDSARLVAAPLGEDPDYLDIAVEGQGDPVKITPLLSGGQLGGILEYRGQVLEPTQNALGRIAIGLADSFNAQHIQGVDLYGLAGSPFFSLPDPQILPASGNLGSLSVTFDDVSALSTEDYTLSHDGANWTLSRFPGGQSVPFESGTGSALDPYIVDGLSMDLSLADPGDVYLIRPTRSGGGDLSVVLTEGAQIAAGDPGQGVGGNGNALSLAGLQNGLPLLNGTASYEDAYAIVLGDVGTRTRQAEITASAQQKLLTESQTRRSSISGVNLDEEAANLIRFQQAYEAAARIVSAADTMFQSLLEAVR